MAPLDGDTAPADVDWDRLQSTLAETGVMLSFFNEFDMATDTDWVAPVQYLGAKGFFASYDARPEEPLDSDLAAVWAVRTAAIAAGDAGDATEFARRVMEREESESMDPIGGDEFATLLEDAFDSRDLDVPSFDRAETASELTRGGACVLIYDVLTG